MQISRGRELSGTGSREGPCLELERGGEWRALRMGLSSMKTFCLLFGLKALDLGPFSAPSRLGGGGLAESHGKDDSTLKYPLWPMPP